MRNNIALLNTPLILLLCAVGLAQAQAPPTANTQGVRITSGPRVEHVDEHQAIIAWSTNASAGSMVRYGSDPQKLDQKAEMPWGGFTHRVTLTNLQPGTTYYFQAESAQAQGTGTTVTSDVAQLRTTGQGKADAAPSPTRDNIQIQAGPIIQNIVSKSAVVWWQTNRPAETIVKYGVSPGKLTQTAQKPFGDQSHRVELTNLAPGTKYYVAIARADNTQRAATEFKTEPANAAQAKRLRIINGPVIEYLSDKSIVIAWSTEQRSSSVVHYGGDPNTLDQKAKGDWSQATHRLTIKDLKPNTKYYFVVESAAGQGGAAVARSEPAPFQTVSSGEAALRISMQH